MYKSINSLNRSVNKLNTSVENMNNMVTPAYKAKSVSFHETLDGLKTGTHRDFNSGAARKTRRDLDFAIFGTGFFEIQMPDGTLAYTRQGSFKVSATGELVTAQGYALSSKQNVNESTVNQSYDAITNDNNKFNLSVLSKSINVPTGETIKLANNNSLKDSQGNDLGELRLVTFQNIDGLKEIGQGIFVATAEAGDIDEVKVGDKTGETQIKQGYIESSNVSIVDNMAKIVQTNTTIKAHLKVIKMLDQMQENINSTLSRSV